MTAPEPPAMRERWWRMSPFRLVAATAVVAAGYVLYQCTSGRPALQWSPLHDGAHLTATPRALFTLVVAAFFMTVMPQVSYRKRDVLLLLIPVVGLLIAIKVVMRAMYLPRRDWLPRTEEIPRAVRIPHGCGDWFLARDFAEAEHYRTRWCTNPHHEHPYDSWELAHQIGCRGPVPARLG